MSKTENEEQEPLPGFFDDRSSSYENIVILKRPEPVKNPPAKTRHTGKKGNRVETIRVKYFADGLPELRYVDGKSDWIDLCAAEDVEMKAGEYRLIPLGVAMALPEGYEAHVVPRSSTFARYGILQANSMGVVDYSYRGDGDQWKFPAYAVRDTVIPRFSRICQFRIIRNQPPLRFECVEHLCGPDRGGFGSTGF